MLSTSGYAAWSGPWMGTWKGGGTLLRLGSATQILSGLCGQRTVATGGVPLWVGACPSPWLPLPYPSFPREHSGCELGVMGKQWSHNSREMPLGGGALGTSSQAPWQSLCPADTPVISRWELSTKWIGHGLIEKATQSPGLALVGGVCSAPWGVSPGYCPPHCAWSPWVIEDCVIWVDGLGLGICWPEWQNWPGDCCAQEAQNWGLTLCGGRLSGLWMLCSWGTEGPSPGHSYSESWL